MRSALAAIVCTSAVCLSTACVVVDSQGHITREEKRFRVTGTPDLQLTTFDGAIEIRAGEGRDVIVEIEKRGPSKEMVERLQVDATQDGNRIDVEVKRPSGDSVFFGHHVSPTAKLIVTMPKHGNIVAKSGDGSIRIDAVHGRLELRTGDGSIRANDVGGQVVLDTHDGSVVLDGVDGDVDLSTGDGSVTVSGKPGALRLKTGDGSITLRADQGTQMKDDWSVTTGDGAVTLEGVDGDVDIETGDGSVSVAGKLGTVKIHTGDGAISLHAESGTPMKDDWSMSTGDGSVTVSLPSDFAAEIDAHTGDGTIRSDLKISGDDSDSERRSLRGKIGSGGRVLRIRTSDGGIRLKSS